MGLRDHYVAVVKASILSDCPDVNIVDISHEITPFNNAEAAYVLGNAYPEFPRGTIHIIGVNPEIEPSTPHIVARHDGHYFIGADNGIFSLLFPNGPHEAFELTMKLDADRISFPTKQVFSKVACHLVRGGTPEVIGRKTVQLKKQIHFRPVADGLAIRGVISHIDNYGNLLTNIDRETFARIGKGRKFSIQYGRGSKAIERIDASYGDVPPGERVAFFGDNDMLEIAVNKGAKGAGGGAAQLFGLSIQDPIIVEFSEKFELVPQA